MSLRSVLVRPLRPLQAALRLRLAEWAVRESVAPRRGRAHGLPGELVVSLTSYPPRFPVLARTLRSLSAQDVRPDRLVLWLAEKDLHLLPQDVRQLESFGVEIRSCPDWGPHKKIIPALLEWSDAFIVTADDDLYYPPNWLRTLVAASDGTSIICRRAHLPKRTSTGFAPYASWAHDFVTAGEPRGDLFPTGGAGALYPPGTLPAETWDADAFMALCPRADDVWLFVMGQRAGATYRQVGGGFPQVSWRGSQQVTLLASNVEQGNDAQLAAVLQRFPIPVPAIKPTLAPRRSACGCSPRRKAQ